MENEAQLFHKCLPPEIGKAVPTPIGAMNFNLLRLLLEDGKFLQLFRGAEVGVYEAATSDYLLHCFSNLQMFCVDPYVDYSVHENDKTSSKMLECETKARNILSKYGERARLIKDYSVPAAKTIENESLDFVFIDAIHSFEAVTEDLNAWYPKVRRGGLISGHDFSWDGVQDAVEAFAAKFRHAAYYTPSTSDVWFFVK